MVTDWVRRRCRCRLWVDVRSSEMKLVNVVCWLHCSIENKGLMTRLLEPSQMIKHIKSYPKTIIWKKIMNFSLKQIIFKYNWIILYLYMYIIYLFIDGIINHLNNPGQNKYSRTKYTDTHQDTGQSWTNSEIFLNLQQFMVLPTFPQQEN